MERKDLLREGIRKASRATLARWSAELDCWRCPEDFPVALPVIEDNWKKFKDPAWKDAWDAVRFPLTEAEQSLGWFIHQKIDTPEGWRSWWLRPPPSGASSSAISRRNTRPARFSKR